MCVPRREHVHAREVRLLEYEGGERIAAYRVGVVTFSLNLRADVFTAMAIFLLSRRRRLCLLLVHTAGVCYSIAAGHGRGGLATIDAQPDINFEVQH
jgi:hypothetical protein